MFTISLDKTDHPDILSRDGRLFLWVEANEEGFYRQALARHNITTGPSSPIIFKPISMDSKHLKIDVLEFEMLSTTEDDCKFALLDATKLSRPYPRRKAINPEGT